MRGGVYREVSSCFAVGVELELEQNCASQINQNALGFLLLKL